MDQIRNSKDADLCERILAIMSAVYQPLTLDEMASFVDIPNSVSRDGDTLSEIIGLCGSFLTLQERTIFVIHQSVKDFLLKEASQELFPSGIKSIHHVIFSRSLRVMSKTLQRDIYSLCAPGYPIEQVNQPDADLLAASRYSCIYWIDHLCDYISNSCTNPIVELQDGGIVNIFLRKKYLYWLEALSLCKSVSDGVVSMAKLEVLLQVTLRPVTLRIIYTDIS